MTINNKSERNYRGKCLGWPVTSYGGGVALGKSSPEFVYFAVEICHRGPLPSATPFPFGKNFAKRQNIKDAVMLGWGWQIFAKSSQTMGIAEATINACQRYMKNMKKKKKKKKKKRYAREVQF